MRWITNLTVVPVIVLLVFTIMGRAEDLPGVSPEAVADYIHAVIEAHRAFYTEDVVDRLKEQGGATADGNWRTQKNTLPLPVHMATRQSCVDCHNAHPHSPRKDFQLGEIMGGLIIEFPLGKR